jgi:plastocyanin
VHRKPASLVIVALLGSSLAGCSSQAPGAQSGPAVVEGTAKPGAGGVQEITVTGDDQLRFAPSVIHAKPGILRITLKTIGGTPHDLEVRPMKQSTGLVGSGEQRAVEVRLDRGSYEFVCTFHVASKMVGSITVA